MARKAAAAPAPMKEASVTFRSYPDLKAALERAALEDGRSVSSLVDRVLRAWLIERGHLPKPKARSGR